MREVGKHENVHTRIVICQGGGTHQQVVKTQEYEKMSEVGNCESRIKCLVKQKTYKTVQSHLPQCLLFIDINNSLFFILKPTSFSINASILNLNYQL